MTDLEQARIRHALVSAPDVIGHIVAQRGEPTRSTQPRVQQSKEPPAPLNITAVDDSDYVYQALTYWAALFANHWGTDAPRTLRQARRTTDGTIVGFPSTITPANAHAAIRVQATWLIDHLDRITADHLADLRNETDNILTLRAKWPTEEGGKQSNTPCPHHDERVAIRVYPPLEYGMPRVIVCDHSHYFDEDQLAALELEHATKLRNDIAERRRTARLMNDLTKRYAQ